METRVGDGEMEYAPDRNIRKLSMGIQKQT